MWGLARLPVASYSAIRNGLCGQLGLHGVLRGGAAFDPRGQPGRDEQLRRVCAEGPLQEVRQPLDLACIPTGRAGPAQPPAVLPLARAHVACRGVVGGETVLFASQPLALIAAAIRPSEEAKAVLEVLLVLALVGAAIWEREDPRPIHLLSRPLPNVGAAITPLVVSKAMNDVTLKLALVSGAVGPGETTAAGLRPIAELPMVMDAVGPDLLALAMLPVVLPLAFIGGTLLGDEFAIAMKLAAP
mmetsp:Transcript_77090/g.213054  ORF Transcript_77090/g.213054 Transcript_77090/m.213054 type:complete len:244 (-) Transcript_77090:87-818(-)